MTKSEFTEFVKVNRFGKRLKGFTNKDLLGEASLGSSTLSNATIGKRYRIFTREMLSRGAVDFIKYSNGGVEWRVVALAKSIDEKSKNAALWASFFMNYPYRLRFNGVDGGWSADFRTMPTRKLLNIRKRYENISILKSNQNN